VQLELIKFIATADTSTQAQRTGNNLGRVLLEPSKRYCYVNSGAVSGRSHGLRMLRCHGAGVREFRGRVTGTVRRCWGRLFRYQRYQRGSPNRGIGHKQGQKARSCDRALLLLAARHSILGKAVCPSTMLNTTSNKMLANGTSRRTVTCITPQEQSELNYSGITVSASVREMARLDDL
jgi:hypothetical protein